MKATGFRRLATAGILTVLLGSLGVYVVHFSPLGDRRDGSSPNSNSQARSVAGKAVGATSTGEAGLQGRGASSEPDLPGGRDVTENKGELADLLPEIQSLQESIFPDNQGRINILASIMKIENQEFGSASDPKIDSLLKDYNRSMSGILSFQTKGVVVCTTQDGQTKSLPYSISFTRQGFKTSLTVDARKASISKGIESFPVEWGKDDCMRYFFLSLSLFDPKEFTRMQEDNISLKETSDSKAQTIACYRIESNDRILYFDKRSSKLARIVVTRPGMGDGVLSIDMFYDTKSKETNLPVTIRINYLDPEAYADPERPWKLAKAEFSISADQLKVSELN